MNLKWITVFAGLMLVVLPVSAQLESDNGLTVDQCAALFKAGKFEQLGKALSVAGNPDAYRVWQMKVQFWNGHYAEMHTTATLLKQRSPAFFGLAGMYSALALIEQNQADNAALVFAAVKNADEVSAPMALFVRGRLAMAKREYREAAQDMARVVALYDQDPEWLPAATLYEGLIYKRTGYLDAAGNVAKELIENYPDGYWARRAGKLK